MSQLRTDWLCVATEGDTVDGRCLERQWLIDAGDLYEPNLYAALIWPEHEKDYGNFGEVLACMWQEGDDGLVRLYVQLRPNAYLLDANRRDQMLYMSVELTPDGNFRGTGRTYLEGLAVTDTPASVGTTRLRFSHRKNRLRPASGYYEFSINKAGKIKQGNKMKNWQSWFGIKPKHFEEQPNDDAPEDGDKLQVLANAVNDLEARITKLEGSQEQTDQAVEEVQADVETVKEVVDTEEFALIRDNAKSIVSNFNKLDKKITKLPKRDIGDKSQRKEFKHLV
ncbi:GPO family capsid scaffolding protein [Hafnia alvei]|uniref:GPO family capsid scaffolding protein n=1 Tax=Hafnia alvei TaxID=569 RepID=UPI00061D1ACB|nr:GPO family capsid scaffolding protein [Hafnia alvei]KKF38773.1 phage capsid scaffolding protein [Hafnia alvei]MBW3475202.1 GPO family capsid scaffolding protein [Hafnia alvei]